MKHIFIIIILFWVFSLYGQVDRTIIDQTILEEIDNSKFDSIAKVLGYKGGDKVRVSTLFTVNEEGQIVNIRAKGPHPIFEQEAIRIIEMVPKLKPAYIDGKAVSPRFALPITFVIESERQKKRRLKKQKKIRESQN